MNECKYYGYGFICTNKARETVNIKTSRDYKALKSAFVDSIDMDIDSTLGADRPVLDALIDKILATGDLEHHILVIPSADTLGTSKKLTLADNETKENIEAAVFRYKMITLIHGLHIIVLDSPQFSTTDFAASFAIPSSDGKKRAKLIESFFCEKLKKHGRKAMSPDNEKFRLVFWNWQNFFIDTADAISLIGCSKTILYQLTKVFMLNGDLRDTYTEEFEKYMVDYEEKPVRGLQVDEDIENTLRKAQRMMGDKWTIEGVGLAGVNAHSEKQELLLEQDYIRMRLNYIHGRAAMAAATKKFSKGDAYVQELKEQLDTISGK